MNKIYLGFLIILSFATKAQINQFGYPLHKYYSPKDYNSEMQNWDAVVTGKGLVYVANNNGVLEYDGLNWNLVNLNNDLEVRALAVDKRGVIFLGGNSEMGYLLPTKLGKLDYTSLMPKLTKEQKEFSYIYKANIIQDTIYFSTDNQLLFKYIIPDDSIHEIKLPEYSLFTFKADNSIYGGSYSAGLFKLNNDKPEIVKGGDFYALKNIFAVLEGVNDSVLHIVTGNSGIFEWNRFTGESLNKLSASANKFQEGITFYSSTAMKNEYFSATLGSGVVVINKNGELTGIYDEEIGIQDHLCSNVKYFENSPVLWATLNIGVANVEINSPFRFFSKESKLDGAVNDIRKIQDKLYVGTDIGLYYLPENYSKKPEFKEVQGLEHMIWSIDEMGENGTFLVGTQNGIFEVNPHNHQLKSVEDNLIGIEKLFEIKKKDAQYRLTEVKLNYDKNDKLLWAGSKSRLIGIERKENRWEVNDLIFNVGDRVISICEDKKHGVWASTSQNGLVYLKNLKPKTYEIHAFDTSHGLPVNYGLRAVNFNDKILVLTAEGIYAYDSITNKFKPYKYFPSKYYDGSCQIRRFVELSDKSIIINITEDGENKVERLIPNAEGYIVANKSFKRIKQFSADAIYEQGSHLWFGVSNTLYSYELNCKRSFNENFNCLIRKVEGRDSVYFLGQFFKETPLGLLPSETQQKQQIPVLDYNSNDLTFYYAAPYFEAVDEIEYSYQLNGFKNNWSKWSKEPKAVFTNLNEGDYTFKVKAKNIYGTESSVANYSFSVLPPWYRTLAAYGFYMVGLFCLIGIIVKLYTRKLKREKIRLEGIVRERTAEIREQRDEIQAQKQSIEDSILYASRIQSAILPSEELAADLLPEHFILFRPRDIVSGDYYWLNKIDNKIIVVAADCTGHGVPGAFMSMLGVSFLNEIVLKERILEPHEILNRLRKMVKRTLKQEGKEGEAKDGMDIALVIIDEETHKLYYAGAYNPVYIFRKGELHEIKADRMPIGIYIREKESFTLNEFEYQKGDTFYIFSDGYPDQFGGEKGQKFRSKAMKKLLSEIQDKTMEEQKIILEKTITDWMGHEYEQIDDMVLIGVKL